MPQPGSPWNDPILLVLILLFGSKKLPDTARALGESLRLFKKETSKLNDEDDTSSRPEPAKAVQAPAAAARPADERRGAGPRARGGGRPAARPGRGAEDQGRSEPSARPPPDRSLAAAPRGTRMTLLKRSSASKRRDDDGRMPLMEHIRELRNRLIKASSASSRAPCSASSSSTRSGTSSRRPYCRLPQSQPARPGVVHAGGERRLRRVLRQPQGRADLRDRRVLPALAVPDLGVRHPRPVPARAALHPVLPRRSPCRCSSAARCSPTS